MTVCILVLATVLALVFGSIMREQALQYPRLRK